MQLRRAATGPAEDEGGLLREDAMTVPNTAQSIDRVGRFRTSIDDCATSSGRDAAAGPDGLQNAMLGVYRLDGVIGAGAVGVVYRA